jgi:hypothetical protein
MIRGFRPYREKLSGSTEPNQAASHWWRPLTHWWGVCGVFIFIGLVAFLIGRAVRWGEDQLGSSLLNRGNAISSEAGRSP